MGEYREIGFVQDICIQTISEHLSQQLSDTETDITFKIQIFVASFLGFTDFIMFGALLQNRFLFSHIGPKDNHYIRADRNFKCPLNA